MWWYHEWLCFSFSCSGYDLTLIKKGHTLNCKLVVSNCGSSTYCLNDKLRKAICFLSLMFCSINKLKSHMLFTCNNFMFSDFTWKKKFCSRKWWEEGGGWLSGVEKSKVHPTGNRQIMRFKTWISRSPMFFKIGVLENFANFTGKHLYCSLFLIKFATKILTQVFSYEICEILKNSFFVEHLWWLLLKVSEMSLLNKFFPWN